MSLQMKLTQIRNRFHCMLILLSVVVVLHTYLLLFRTSTGTFKEGDLAINKKGLLIKGESPKTAPSDGPRVCLLLLTRSPHSLYPPSYHCIPPTHTTTHLISPILSLNPTPSVIPHDQQKTIIVMATTTTN